MKMKSFINRLLWLLYPKRCMLCDEVTRYGETGDICACCLSAVPSYAADTAKALPTAYSEMTGVYSAFRYEDAIRDAVRRFKFQGMKENARTMACMMKHAAWPDGFDSDMGGAQLLIPVPLHKSRLRERGYNQAELLALALAKEYGVPFSTSLVRTKKTESMYGLRKTERFDNIRDAFAVTDPAIVYGKNIVIIDDIYTTGATVEECARTLKKAGAGSICALTFAAAVED